MISHKHKCIFIHIPKTAGMSVENCFLESLGLRFYLGQSAPLLLTYNKNLRIGPASLAHLKATEYLKFNYISKELFDDYYKFSFVRNPYHRTVSIYKHFKYDRIISFSNFLKVEFPKILEKRKYFVQPQVDFVIKNKEDLVVDKIFKYENLYNSITEIESHLCHSIAPLRHINKSLNNYNIYSKWNIKFIYKTLLEFNR